MTRLESHRGVHAIDPAHLRDHADEARLLEIWRRLEPSLPAARAHGRAPGRPRVWRMALAAALASFAAGLVAGHWLTAQRATEPRALLPFRAAEEQSREVFAAGTVRRVYALPGGGSIELSPSSIVDTVAMDGDGLTLRLVRGEASVSTRAAGAPPRSARLALWVGDATITTDEGRVRVRHSGDSAELHVVDGAAEVTSPDVEQGSRRAMLGPDQRITVPIRVLASRIAPKATETKPLALSRGDEPEGEPPPAAGWRELCGGESPDYEAVGRLLRSEAGSAQAAIAAAQSAGDLACISNAYRTKGGDQALAALALTRLVERFPEDARAGIARFTLCKIHQKAGNYEQVQTYCLSADGVLAEDALCRTIQTAAEAGRVDDVLRLAGEYRTKYPDGPCSEEIERLEAEAAAQQDAGPPGDAGVDELAEEDPPEADEEPSSDDEPELPAP